ncbi:Retrovirus-related Pol polyprotein from transposon opus, partial [Mucuna pruriens]
MGRITALSCFISRSVETVMLIFGALKKAGNFTWMPECEEAFMRFKAMLVAPPVLTCSVEGMPLYLYIFVSNTAISAVLVQEKDGSQRPIYFISKVLQGAEQRYQKIEKAALALVVTSRRLRPYFRSYSVIVWTDLPIRQVLKKPDLAGVHVKAQALADFLTQLMRGSASTVVGGESDEGEWYLLVDESSNQVGSGAGVILEGLVGVVIEQSLHFEFKASNNQTEYKALLAGMWLARELEARRLTAKSDSKLMTG